MDMDEHQEIHWPSFLLQMAGRSGAGKSTLARLVGARTGAVVIDLDVVKTASLDAGSTWDLAGRIGYEASRALADSLLGQRRSVILDSPCRFQQIVDGGSAIAVQHSVPMPSSSVFSPTNRSANGAYSVAPDCGARCRTWLSRHQTPTGPRWLPMAHRSSERSSRQRHGRTST